jgi:pimeloyl-ACP methyl ester carboxylesterase
MVKFILGMAGVAVAIYLCVCLALFLFQRSLIYYPPRTASLQAPQVETLALPGATVKVSERPHDGAKALIYFGGNAEDVSSTLPQLAQAFPDHALYLMHYRGYAGSSGKPTERDLVADALALFDHVAAAHPEVVLIGRSLGTGIAVQVASQRPVSKLVLVTPYDSIEEIAARQFRWFPVRWMLRDRYLSGRYAPRIGAPTLIVAAGHDEVIPGWSTRLLLSRFAPGVATMRVIDGVGHNTISNAPEYVAALAWAR